MSRLWLYKRKPKVQFKGENGITTKKTIIRVQTARKIKKSIPDNLKKLVWEPVHIGKVILIALLHTSLNPDVHGTRNVHVCCDLFVF